MAPVIGGCANPICGAPICNRRSVLLLLLCIWTRFDCNDNTFAGSTCKMSSQTTHTQLGLHPELGVTPKTDSSIHHYSDYWVSGNRSIHQLYGTCRYVNTTSSHGHFGASEASSVPTPEIKVWWERQKQQQQKNTQKKPTHLHRTTAITTILGR